MPTGERSVMPASGCGGPPTGRGFTYVGLLFALALAGAGLAALGEQWQLRTQREREAELLFRGGEIARALAAFASRTEVGERRPARDLDELLVDARGPRPVHHLRRLYTDPFTGVADWRLELDARGAITGVASRALVPALRQRPAGVELRAGASVEHASVGDWVFRPRSPAPNPPLPGVLR